MGAKKVTEEEIKNRLLNKHGSVLSMKAGTFSGTHKYATFIDAEFGEWSATVKSVTNGSTHPKRWAAKRSFDEKKVKDKIYQAHGNIVTLKEGTYTKAKNKAIFVDKDFGEWECTAILVWRGHGHPHRADLAHRKSLEEVTSKISKIHEGRVGIIESTYKMVSQKAVFMDVDFGKWECLVNSVLQGSGHPNRKNEKSEKTCLQRYGVKNASQDPVKALKAAKKTNEKYIRKHWKTGEELVCQASWEPKVVEYLNAHSIDFLWQPKVFQLPNGQTYRPDLFLINENKWIEIKGLMRPKSQIKWDLFKIQFPTAELWNKNKLKELNIL